MSLSMQSSTRATQDRLRRLSSEEATRLIRIARRKSSDGASKDRNLRVFLAHSHVAETLRHEFLDQPFRTEQQHITWAEPIYSSSRQSAAEVEDEAVSFEDDGEEDFASLTLMRTPSRSAQAPRSPV